MTTTNIPRGKYHIWTVGCQMNQADSQRIQAILEDLGWEETGMDQANLVVLNTCSVRQAPEEKAHNLLAQLKRVKEKRDDLLVALMGCMIGKQKTIDELSKRYPHIDLFMKVEQADILPRFLEERWTPISGAGCLDIEFMDNEQPAATPVAPAQITPTFATSFNRTGKRTVLPMAIVPKPGERVAHYPTNIPPQAHAKPTAWLPIVLGCNKVCTYCIVPYRRGRERSRPIDELMVEARTLVDKGAKELTLLGQTIEAYGLDLPGQPNLADLMESLSEIEGLKRIRFMTSYPRHMTDDMIRRMAAMPKVCEHLNIPVQAGHNDTLKRMKRGYTIEEYCERIDRVRELWPKASLSTDIIVGFCGETEEEFQTTLDMLAKIRFDVVHVAAYSVRPGTVAARWEDDIPLAEKKRRLHAVEEQQARIALEINQPLVGSIEEVMVEEINTSRGLQQWKGRNRTNKLVFFPAPDDRDIKPGDLVNVRIERATAWSLQGCAVAEPSFT
ncbi:tRNA-2-methylthio-N6-dimethylallyladenosine synthase [Thermosporothrix hazakensis]|jgi:tRNA-2-methylthio-N6-dimethylallyladenosine synthase|uniref:tRNA-2-methylthio-N(6)-dimethylallyladenosine synthase n=2 Tax=Thermosporothrix TaxID=768650 RepID=A0A326UBS9_THEHA|nr:MiaB/RimO family radical SAM methylthiotransferase [Thermosporothrix hazakensis]PZW36072.1 tRNA-2-methylthio-N6-dimethylallyladenosine synthase [Thermosporothrix hazakensis]BBH88538.1 tRNA-2-methylthio-N(6)-dimethylallyladenosine synthase [Thermosporothrix sp. COM3]GCE46723.1 tRNA-2-methylthio-N(6)-dimethylallyladenosine synthase [Thermosporothrix hazakensis]